ncbi:hypothetical protein Cgig2_033497 [Carnegiea gigantea]|uniref:DUF4283 domain-containing protein n=1 Tax=Carnegiea gigantea TaxID=171969 RepID=A0A9Q1JX82_9CARY|nr:hypothetical protein Cgig2_033497 [Carnegiea gigantea]
MDLCTKSLKSLPIWIQLPDLDLNYWGLESLSKVSSTLGIPLKTDKYTQEKSKIRYARVLVDMQLDGHFPEFIEFFNEHDILISQQVHYEWVPVKCKFCGTYGHVEDVCKKKTITRKEWRVKQPLQVMGQENTPQHIHDKAASPQPAINQMLLRKKLWDDLASIKPFKGP